MKTDTHTIEREIFAVGKWNGMSFNAAALDDFVSAFDTLKSVLRVPLKLGHEDKEPLKKGQPALGWVEKIWRKGNVLMGRFTDVPDVVYSAMQKRYPKVSIEASWNVRYKGDLYKRVMTGVALLGADIPAVNTLDDLHTYMSADQGFSWDGQACFSANLNEGGNDMPTVEELQAQLAQRDAEFKAAQTDAAAKVKAAEDKAKELDDKITALQKEGDEAKFTAAVEAVTQDLEKLVKEKKLIPGKRDELVKSITDDATLQQVQFAAKTLGDMKVTAEGVDTDEQGKGGAGDRADDNKDDVQEVLQGKISEFRATHKVSVKEATEEVLAANPELAKEYINFNEETDAA